jgi:hypothetical protein
LAPKRLSWLTLVLVRSSSSKPLPMWVTVVRVMLVFSRRGKKVEPERL